MLCGFWLDIEGAHQASENKKKEEASFYQEYLQPRRAFWHGQYQQYFDYSEQFGHFIKNVIQLEKSLCNPRMGQSTILEEFLYYYLNGEFPHYGEIRDAIDELKVVKKMENGTI